MSYPVVSRDYPRPEVVQRTAQSSCESSRRHLARQLYGGTCKSLTHAAQGGALQNLMTVRTLLAGTYSNEAGATFCRACPADSSSPAGSDALTDCKCNDGFSGPDGGPCVADGTNSSDGGRTCVPFDVKGTTVCVPDHLTPAETVEDCSLSLTWKELRNGWSDYGYVTGGLGKLMVLDLFEVWLCAHSPHPCAAPSDPVCFTYSEVDSVFVPWGFNSTLDLGHTMPSVSGRRRGESFGT